MKTAGEIIACRFILGFVEAPFFPGILFYLSKWYTKKELSLRMAIFYSGSLVSGAFGNLIAAGILNGLAGQRGYAAWQWLYIIEGAITIFVSLPPPSQQSQSCFFVSFFPAGIKASSWQSC